MPDTLIVPPIMRSYRDTTPGAPNIYALTAEFNCAVIDLDNTKAGINPTSAAQLTVDGITDNAQAVVAAAYARYQELVANSNATSFLLNLDYEEALLNSAERARDTTMRWDDFSDYIDETYPETNDDSTKDLIWEDRVRRWHMAVCDALDAHPILRNIPRLLPHHGGTKYWEEGENTIDQLGYPAVTPMNADPTYPLSIRNDRCAVPVIRKLRSGTSSNYVIKVRTDIPPTEFTFPTQMGTTAGYNTLYNNAREVKRMVIRAGLTPHPTRCPLVLTVSPLWQGDIDEGYTTSAVWELWARTCQDLGFTHLVVWHGLTPAGNLLADLRTWDTAFTAFWNEWWRGNKRFN